MDYYIRTGHITEQQNCVLNSNKYFHKRKVSLLFILNGRKTVGKKQRFFRIIRL